MTTLYNEIEPFAADWITNLVEAGHIAPGVVDRRSIADIVPDDVRGRPFHTFAGIGVWSLALRVAGVPDDVPIWTGSCPCQPFSDAGLGGGFADERHLWPTWFRLIAECRPPIVFGEQVASADGLAWLDLVQTDLEGAGYTFAAFDLCAAGFGAPHIRQRLYFVAYSDDDGREVLRRLRRSLSENLDAQPRDHAHRRRSTGRRSGVGERGQVVVDTEEERRGSGRDRGARPSVGTGRRTLEPRRSGADLGMADDSGERWPEGGLSFDANIDDWPRPSDGSGLGHAGSEGSGRDAGGVPGPQGSGRDAGGVPGPQGSGSGGRIIARDQSDLSVAASADVALGDADGSRSQGWRLLAGDERDQWPARRSGEDFGTGATGGYWRDCDWIPCRDPQRGIVWRPVEPGAFPLAYGVAGRVGRLRAYGNAINGPQAEIFVEEALNALFDLFLEPDTLP